MAISYTLHNDEHLLITRYRGHLTLQDCKDVYHAIFASIGNWTRIAEVKDLSGLESMGFGIDGVRELAETMADRLRGNGMSGRVAILAPNDKLYGMASIYCAQAAFAGWGGATAVRDLAEAAKWVGVTAERLTNLMDPDDG